MDAAAALAAWDNEPAPLWVRVNGTRFTVEEALGKLAEEGVNASAESPVPGYLLLEAGVVPAGLRGLEEGWLTVQDPSAGIASYGSMPLEGATVADICAAPGGKSTHLVELGGKGAEVAATDSDPERFRMLEDTALRHAAQGLSLRPYDEIMAARGRYDRVLVDAPCSNLGVLRRRADARWRVQTGDPELLADVQYRLLSKAGELVCPGGVLVYSTCTLLPVYPFTR
jgi:16S rRNA (cytosine967-C5)-methyltransferase